MVKNKVRTKPSQLTARSMNVWRKFRYIVDKVEQWNSFARKKKDLFGFIDILAMSPSCGDLIGIQVTSKSNMLARAKKICMDKKMEAQAWLVNKTHRLYIEGWYKNDRNKWEEEIWEICLDSPTGLTVRNVKSNKLIRIRRGTT